MEHPSSASLISVIIPCYRQGRFLADAIESVLRQTYSHFELIVVDDGSPDETCEVARGYSQVKYLRKPNGGAATARNAGLRQSHGDFLVFLDADDRLVPRAFEIGLAAFAARPECAMTFGSSRRTDESGNPLPSFWRHLDADDYYLRFLRRSYLYNPASAMFRRSVFAAGVAFDESIRVCSDYDVYLQVARGWPVYCHNEVLSEYRQHVEQQTLNRRAMVDTTVRILAAQAPFIRNRPAHRKMAKKGSRLVRHAYSHYLLMTAWEHLRKGEWLDARKLGEEFVGYDFPLAAYVLPWAILRAWHRRFQGVKRRATEAIPSGPVAAP